MKFAILSVVGAFAALANAAAIDSDLLGRASKTSCYTVKTGFVTVYEKVGNDYKNVPVGINTKHQITYGTKDHGLEVEFQACPQIGTQYPNLNDYTGQIKVKGSSNCLTVSNPTAPEGGPFFLQTAKCKSTTIPPASQRFEYGNDFGAVVFWMGASKTDEIGYTVDDNDVIQTEKKTHRIELGCAKSCASFSITPKNKL